MQAQTPERETKRIFGMVPNYRSAPSLDHHTPLKTSEKFKIATQDSFDRGTVILSAAFAGTGQLTNSNPSFGQGVQGYASYLGTSYADLVIANDMTISALGGNATAVAISNAYYPDSRIVSDNLTKFVTQIGVDMASNILKEFTPDLYRKFRQTLTTSRSG